jgi:hypothetical protein
MPHLELRGGTAGEESENLPVSASFKYTAEAKF